MRWFYRFFCKDNICGAENIHNLNEKGFTPEWSGRRSLSAFVYIRNSLFRTSAIQILINQDAVDCFQVECNFAFRFILDGEEIFRTFEHLFVSEIDESRIERLLTAGMQAVVCQVFHRTEVCRFDADKVIILLVVRQCETQSVDSFDTVTLTVISTVSPALYVCFGVERKIVPATRSVPGFSMPSSNWVATTDMS